MVDIVTRLGKGSPLTNAEVDANFTNLAEVSGVTGEPMGHEDRTTSTISFNASTRTFTIAPTASSFTVWCKGKKVVVSSARTVTIPNTTGMYSIYFDSTGTLAAKSGYFTFAEEAPTAYIYWNATTGTAPYFGDERHGVVLDWQTHEYLHRTRGAALASGFSASGYVLGGNGSSNSHAQLTLEGGTFFDEDMKIIVTATNTPTAGTWEQDLTSPARIPVLYLSGTAWVIDSPTDYPLKQGTARPQYNAFSGGVWSTADVANNKYATSWILATNNLTYPVIAIIGQAESDLQSAAEAVDFTALQLPGFPSVEFRPLYKLIFQCADSCTNAVHASLVSITDIRSIVAAGTAASIVTDHGNLSGLSDDDHPQYLSVDTVRGSLTAAVKASFLPSQTSNAGKFLQTDGTATSWQALTSGNVTTALGFTPYNATNPSGYISGITSGMVTTALGFTPYNATNPSGYVTAAGARGAISVTGAGSYDSATGVINIVGGVTSFNTRTGAITLSSADVTTALGFTPYNSTNPNGYLTGITSTQVTTALGYTPYNSSNPSGYITGITSGMVTTALGFTPYNNSNPSGYITSSALSGYLTSASAASTYLPLSGGTVTGNVTLNTSDGEILVTPTGWRSTDRAAIKIRSKANTPAEIDLRHTVGGVESGWHISARDTSSESELHLYRFNMTSAGAVDAAGSFLQMFTFKANGGFNSAGAITQAGNQVLHAGNYNSYSPTLTGTGASGTWGINVTGYSKWIDRVPNYQWNNATLPTGYNSGIETSFVSAAEGWPQYGVVLSVMGRIPSDPGGNFQLYMGHGTNYGGTSLRVRSVNQAGNVWTSWKILLDETNYTSYAMPSGSSATNSVDVRAPIFYDSDNTGYYVNPASSSNIGSWVSNSNGNTQTGAASAVWQHITNTDAGGSYAYLQLSASGAGNGYLIKNRATANGVTNQSLYLWNDPGPIEFVPAGNAGLRTTLNTSGSMTVATDVRAPIFYDSNDTTFYVDPNNTSTSAVFAGNISMNGAIVRRSAGTGYLSGNYASSETTATSGAIYTIGGSYYPTSSGLNNMYGIGFTYASVAGGAAGYTGGSAWGLYVASNGNTRVFLDSDYGRVLATGDMRAPVYYDSDNTSYYVDSNNTSNLNLVHAQSVVVTGTTTDRNVVRAIPKGASASYNNTVTGAFKIRLPFRANDMMWMMTVKIYDYSGNSISEYQIGNYSYSAGAYQIAASFFGSNNAASRTVRLGNDGSYDCVWIGETSGTWNHPVIAVTDFMGGYANASASVIDDNWDISLATSFGTIGGTINPTNRFYSVTAEASVSAPVFYDSNNTAYYTDPASATSGSFAGFVGIGNSYGSDDGGWGSRLNVGGGPHARLDVRCANDGIITTMFSHTGNGVGKIGMMSNHPLVLMAQAGSTGGYVYSGSVRSSIFYDSDDTTYYVDPNSTGVALRIAGAIRGDHVNWTGEHNKIQWHSAHMYFQNMADGYWIFRKSTGAEPFLLHADGWAQASGSWRAPIFYDSNDTSFYLNPNSTSVLNGIDIKAGSSIQFYTAAGSLRGYINVTDTDDNHFQIATSGGEDIVFKDGGLSGTRNFVIRGSNAGSEAYGSMRSPIFYDSNDTGFYVDPNGTSRLNGVSVYTGALGFVNAARGSYFGYSTGYGTVIYGATSGSITPCINVDPIGNASGSFNGNGGEVMFRNGVTFITPTSANTSYHANILQLSEGNVYFGNLAQASGSLRAPIFYDSNDTSYYVDPANISITNRMGANYFQYNGAVSTDNTCGLYFDSGLSAAYAIYRQSGAWTSPYPDLRIAFHTGIQIGANSSYQGVRFYTDYDMSSQVMSVNNGSDALGGGNVYVNNSLQAGSSLRAPVFYDSDDTGYYVNPNGTARMADIYANRIGVNQGVNASWPLIVSGNAYLNAGGYGQAEGSWRAPIFYDSNDTSYYLDPHSTSVLNRISTVRTNDWLYIDNNYGHSVVGVYDSYRYQGVFAMGNSYKLPADGTTTGNLYGMAWSHPNAGGAAGNLTDHGLLIINNGGFRCAISNSIVASANITAYSDERLKTNWRDMPEDYVTRLAKVKVGIYDRVDQEDVTQVGVSAQSFQELLPQAIMTAKDEMQTLSVSYGNAALASAVELAKEVVDLRNRVAQLESLITKLIGD